jgi:hypothetical protein
MNFINSRFFTEAIRLDIPPGYRSAMGHKRVSRTNHAVDEIDRLIGCQNEVARKVATPTREDIDRAVHNNGHTTVYR